MKKLFVTIGLAVAGLASASAQGTISMQNLNALYLTFTNTTLYSSSLNGVYNTSTTSGGLTSTTANAYYYALLVQNGANSVTGINPLDPSWSLGMSGTNYLSPGGMRGAGGSAGAAVPGLPAPTTGSYNNTPAGMAYYLIVGWSANLGSTWSAVAAQLQSGNWVANGFFGVSALGLGAGGGGPNSLSAPSVFGTGLNAGGLVNGVTLYQVEVPEPGTLALAAIGGASLLLFRRKK